MWSIQEIMYIKVAHILNVSFTGLYFLDIQNGKFKQGIIDCYTLYWTSYE